MKWLPAFLCLLCLLSCQSKRNSRQAVATDSLQTQRWQGIIKAITCERIEVTLEFTRRPGEDNGTYKMNQLCKDNDNAFPSAGVWRIEAARKRDTVYVLQQTGESGERYYKVKGSRLVELDADRKEVDTYYLERAR